MAANNEKLLVRILVHQLMVTTLYLISKMTLLFPVYLCRFANKKAYVVLYGFVGCIISATYAYFNGTITTMEKRYKIPSRNTGIISVGNDISTLFLSAVVSYYAGKGHRPRWIAFGRNFSLATYGAPGNSIYFFQDYLLWSCSASSPLFRTFFMVLGRMP